MDNYSNQLYDFLIANSDDNFRNSFPTYGDFEKRIKDTAYVSDLYSFLYDRSDDNFRQSFPDVVSFSDRLKKKEVSSKDSTEDSSEPKRVLETDLQRGRLSADALGDISSVLSLTDKYGEVSEKGFENVYPDVVIPQEGEDVVIDGVNISGLEQIVKRQASEFGSPAAGQLQRGELEIQDEDILNFAQSSKAGLSKSDFLVKELANVSDVVNRNYKAAGGQGSLIEMDGSTAVGVNRNALNYSMLSSDYFQKEMMKEQAEGIARTLAMQMTPAGGQYIISRQLLGGAEGLGAGVYAWFDSEGAQNYLLRKSARDTGFKNALGLSQEQIEKGIIENFSEGDVEAGMTNLLLTGLEQVPQLALMSVAPKLGMATLAVSAGGQQYSSLMVNPDVSKGAAVSSGILLGAAEAMTERIFRTDVNQLRRAITMSRYGSIKEIFKDKSVLKNLRGFGMSFVKSGSEEALEEGIVGILEQVTNAYIAGDSINLYEIADAAAVGFAMGGNTRLVTGLPSFIGSMQTTKQLAKINNEIKKAEELLSKAQGPYAKQVANERVRQLREQAAKFLVSDQQFYDQMTDEELSEVTAINQKIAQANMQHSQANSEAEAELARGVMESELAKKQEIENRYGRKKEGEVPSAEQAGETVKQALPEQERSPEQIEADRVSSEEADNIFGQDRSLNNVSERAGRKEKINEQEIEDAINDGYAMLDEIEANDNLSEQDKATMSELIEDQIETLEGYELQTKTETRKVAKTKTVRTVKKTPRKTEPTREKEFVGAKAVYSDNEGGGGRGVVTKEEGPDGKNYYIIETADGQKILLGEESTLFNETTVNRDENGNPVSITTPVGKDGKQVTIKNPEVAGIFDIEQGKQEVFDEQIFEETYIEVVGEEDVEVLSPRPKPTPRPKPQPKKTESEQKTEEKAEEKAEEAQEEVEEEAKEEAKEEAVKPTNIDDMSQTEIEKFIRDNAGPVGKLLLRAIRNVKNTVGVLGYEVIMVSRNKMGELEGSNPMEAPVGLINTKAKKIYVNVQDGADLAGKIKGDSEEVRAAFREYQEKAIVRGVYHEAFHALFINAFGENPAMLKPFVATLSRAIRASLSQEMANEVVGKLNTFVEQYEGDNTKLDEFITELAAIMTTSRVNADEDPIILKYPTLAGRIRNIFNNFFARIGSDFRFTSDDDIIAFMNSAARGLEAGTRATTILEENERLLKDRFVAQAQGSVGPIRKSKRSEADEILLETVETQIKTGPDKIDYAPDGVYVNIGMIEGRTNKKVSQEQVFNALPDNIIDEYVFVPVEERHEDGGDLVYEDTLIFRLKRPLTDEEMLSLRKELFQFAVPQIVDGDAAMFGRDFGPFDPKYFIMLDKKRLLDSDPSIRKSKRLLAPNGQPSNLNEVQHRIVRTPQFKNWFGDWENDPENASKALDENGEPLVLYHGTNNGRFIDESGVFARQRNRLGFRNYFPFRTPIQLNENQGLWFFTDDPKVAETYMGSERNVGRRLVPAFLSIKNPLIVDAKGDKFSVAQFPLPPEGKEPLNIFQQAIKDQNDAVIINNVKDDFTAEVLTNTYTVFESNQIKLADGSNTTFDSDDLDIRKSKRAGLEVVSKSPNNIDQAFEMAKTTAASVNVEFKDELQDIFNTQTKRIMAQEYGVKDFSTAKGNEPLKRYLVDAYLAEVLTAVKKYPQALGWYDAKTKAAMDIMSTIHPELATDVDALNLFKIAVAITSNGNKVDQNFKEADRVYRYYKENGEFDTKRSLGTQSSAIKSTFRLVNRALQKMTVAEFTEFLTTKMQAGELSYRAKDGKKGKLVDGHTVNTEVYGASIFGPKIGNGFFMNLYGAYEMLTMDRWFIRTYGRLTGTLIQRDKAAIQGARVRLKNSLQALSVAERKVLRDVIGPYSKLNLSEIARLINSKSTKEDLRAVISKGKLNEVRLAGNGLVTKEKGEVEAPRGGNNRNFIKSVFDEVQQRLKDENDLDITMADIQAVIWYPEKALYEEYKKGKKVDKKSNESKDKDAEQPDYENAAEKLAKEFNITQKQIDDARRSKPTGKLDGRRAGQRGGDDARKAQVKEEIIKAKAGNKFDRLLEETKTRKSKRIGLTTLEGRGKQIATTLDADRPIKVIPLPERFMLGFKGTVLERDKVNEDGTPNMLWQVGRKFPHQKGGVYLDADKLFPLLKKEGTEGLESEQNRLDIILNGLVSTSGEISVVKTVEKDGVKQLVANTKLDKNGNIKTIPQLKMSENLTEMPDKVTTSKARKTDSKTTKTTNINLYKKRVGWKWTQVAKKFEDLDTIVSIETESQSYTNNLTGKNQIDKHHIYALSFESTTPMKLKNFPKGTSEPRLRPETVGKIFLGTQIGEMEIGGKKHPVYDQVISYDPNDPSVVERLAYSQSKVDQENNIEAYKRLYGTVHIREKKLVKTKNDPKGTMKVVRVGSKTDPNFNPSDYIMRNPTDDLFKDVNKYVLKTLGFEGAKHIGSGVEADVYDIGGGRVIRISDRPSRMLNSLTGKSIDGLVKVYSTGRVEFPKNLIAKRIPKFVNLETKQLESWRVAAMKRKQQQMKKLPVGYYSIMKKESTEGVVDDLKDLFFKISNFLSMKGFQGGYTFTSSLFRKQSKFQLRTTPELQLNEEEMQELRESLTEQQVKDLDRFLQIDKNAREAGIQLYDTHAGNFARDSEGSLVAIDLDTALDGEIKAEEKTVVRKAKRVTKSFDRATEKRTEGHARDLITNLDKKRNKLRGIALIRNYFFDRQGVVRKLIRESGNKMLLASLSTRNGSSAHAKKLFDEKAKDIFEGVFGNKLKYLSEIIMLRRIVSIEDGIPLKIDKVMQKIDDEKARKNPRSSELTKLKKELYNLQNFKHPENHTRQSAMDKMDEIRQRINDDDQFFDLRNRADKYFDVMRFVLKRKYDNGLIDKDTYDSLANYEYSPRIFIDKMFDVEGGNFDQKERTFMKGYGLSEAEFKKLKSGSTEDLFGDAEFLMRMVIATNESRIFSNRLYKELANSTNLKWVSDTDLDGFREVKYKDNGEVRSIFVRADLADQIEYPDDGVSKSERSAILQWALGSKVLRAMATGYNPLFPIANVPMDFMNIIFFTDVYDNKNVFHAMALLSKQFIRNAAGLRTKNPNTMANLKEALEAGMGMDYLTNQGRLEFDKKSKSQRQKFWKDGLDIVKSFSENSEMAMRLSVYNKVKEEELAKGATEEAARTFAAYKARATIDFSQGGTISKSVDAYVPYFNASLQALRVAGEYTTGKETRGTFVKKIAQAGTAVTMLTILGRMLAEAGDWDEEDEMAISQHDKDNYFIIRLPFVEDKNGDKMYIRIRKNPQLAPFLKPFEWGGNAIYDALNGATDEDIIQSGKRAFAEMVNQINDATIFGDTFFEIDEKTLEPKINPSGIAQYTPPVAKGIMQYISGYDFFRERNISPDKMMVDMGQIGMGQEGMFDPSVVEFYKKAAKVAEGTPFEFSPARMQNLVQTIVTSPSTNIMVAFAYGMMDLDLSEIPKLAGQRAVRSAVKGYSRVTLDPEFIKENQAYNAAQNKIRYEIGQMINVDEATPQELDTYIDGIEDPKLRDFAKKRRRFNVRKSRFKGRILQNKAKYIELDSYLRERPKYAAQWMYREIGDISNNDLVEIAGYIKDMRGSSSFTYPPEFIREYRRLQQEARK